MLRIKQWFYQLPCYQRSWVRVAVCLCTLFFVLAINVILPTVSLAQSDLFSQLVALQPDQAFPPSLQSQSESVDKRGQKQIYYYRSSNYVYPHFVEIDTGVVTHVAIFIEPAKVAEYAQKLTLMGKPEVVVENTENETVIGFPSKGVVFVVNAQKQPVVYERMKPISEKVAIDTYSSDVVLAAADEEDESKSQQEMLLKYPNQVIKFAVGFYTALLANPKLSMLGVGVIVAVAIVIQSVRTIHTNFKNQRTAEIGKLLQETAAINQQREIAAHVAETVHVPHQPVSIGAAPVFNASAIEAAEFRPSDSSLTAATAQFAQPGAVASEPIAAGETQVTPELVNPYQVPDLETWRQKAQFNPSLHKDIAKTTETTAAITESESGEEETEKQSSDLELETASTPTQSPVVDSQTNSSTVDLQVSETSVEEQHTIVESPAPVAEAPQSVVTEKTDASLSDQQKPTV